MVHAVVVHVDMRLALGVSHQLTDELLEARSVVAASNNLEVRDAHFLADRRYDGHRAPPRARHLQHHVLLEPCAAGHEPLMEAALVNIDEVLAPGHELCHFHRHSLLLLIEVVLLSLLPKVGILRLYEAHLVAAVHIP
jgi:hypothetical protein